MAKITLFQGDDYCIIWNDNEQVFCYHGGISQCVYEVCKTLGVAFEDADASEGEFDWESVEGLTLEEFNDVVRDRRNKSTKDEIRQLEMQIAEKKKKLRATKNRKC